MRYISISMERFCHVINFTVKEGRWARRNIVYNHLFIEHPDVMVKKKIIDNSKEEWYKEYEVYMEVGDCLFDVDWEPIEESGFVKTCKIIERVGRRNKESAS